MMTEKGAALGGSEGGSSMSRRDFALGVPAALALAVTALKGCSGEPDPGEALKDFQTKYKEARAATKELKNEMEKQLKVLSGSSPTLESAQQVVQTLLTKAEAVSGQVGSSSELAKKAHIVAGKAQSAAKDYEKLKGLTKEQKDVLVNAWTRNQIFVAERYVLAVGLDARVVGVFVNDLREQLLFLGELQKTRGSIVEKGLSPIPHVNLRGVFSELQALIAKHVPGMELKE